jgi:hypothetical protein
MKTDHGSFRMLQHRDALPRAQKGELEYRYNKEDNLLRVAWRR